jgi:hypothetical protein
LRQRQSSSKTRKGGGKQAQTAAGVEMGVREREIDLEKQGGGAGHVMEILRGLPMVASLATLVYLAAAYLVHVVGLRLTPAVLGGCASLAVAAVAMGTRRRPVGDGSASRGAGWHGMANAALYLAALAGYTVLLNDSWLLPRHDSIAVPCLARALAATGELSNTVYGPQAFHAGYPPGYALLLALPAHLLPPLAFLTLWKALNLAIACAVPLAWAWLANRWMVRRALPFPVVAAFYLAFVYMERTLPYVLPISGKNATLLAATLLPVALAIAVDRTRRYRLPLQVAVLLGVFLVHYTAALLAAFLFAGLWIEGLCRGNRNRLRILGRGTLAFALALLLLLPLRDCMSNPRAAASGSAFVLAEAADWLFNLLKAREDTGVFFFLEKAVGDGRPAFRGLLLLALLPATAALAWLVRTGHYPSRATYILTQHRRTVTILVVAVLAGLILCAVQRGPRPQLVDFLRWFLWIPTAAAMGAALAALADCAWPWRGGAPSRIRALAAELLLLLVLFLVPVMASTPARVRAFAAVGPTTRAEMASLSERLHAIEQAGGQALASVSYPLEEGMRLHTVRVLDFIPYLTTLPLVTGCWIYGPIPGADSLMQALTPDTLATLPGPGTVYVLLSPAERELMMASEAAPLLEPAPPHGATFEVWRVRR